jgi:uncharacterized protein
LPAYTRSDLVVIVFARAPTPGQVKTRLAARLGEWGAARLHARLTRLAVRTALAARCGRVELHGTPRSRNGFLPHLANTFRIELRDQKGADLGERMRHALQAALRRHRGAILIGSDCPALDARDLRKAARLLCGGCDAVLAPAEDGGYVLIALKRVPPGLFDGVAWGGPRVYADTVKKLSGRRWRALRMLWDVDRPADLERLKALRYPSARRPGARR